MKNKKPWSGRFAEETEASVESFTSSIEFDKRLYKYDIMGSIAHSKMLARQKIIKRDEAIKIERGLREIEKEIEFGKFKFSEKFEDIHMNIEKRLIEKVGDVGGKLHTARSRNDQVALDMRLYLREEIGNVIREIKNLKKTIIKKAEDNIDIVMPGYTHLQRAQPVLFSHHIMAYYEMFKRDVDRFKDSLKRVNVMPLGSGAISGTSLPIDRRLVAEFLSFPKITENSVDGVSDRDFIMEFHTNASICMVHISRLAEELILWATDEFDFIDIPDAYCTGSSMMPQKKNPDVLELLRGKTGRVYGDMLSIFTTMKALPLAYNRDMQEDKPPLFDTVDTLKSSLSILSEVIGKIRIKSDKMRIAVNSEFMLATDVVEYLVEKGMPFRKAHEVVGNIVKYCLNNNKEFSKLTLREFNSFSNVFKKDIFDRISIEGSINSKRCYGGTSKREVYKAIMKAKRELAK